MGFERECRSDEPSCAKATDSANLFNLHHKHQHEKSKLSDPTPQQVPRPSTATLSSSRKTYQRSTVPPPRSISPTMRREEQKEAPPQHSKTESQNRPGSWRTSSAKKALKTKSISTQASLEDLDIENSASLRQHGASPSPIGTPLSSGRLASSRLTSRQSTPQSRPQSQSYRRGVLSVTTTPVRSSRRIPKRKPAHSHMQGPHGPSPYAVKTSIFKHLSISANPPSSSC